MSRNVGALSRRYFKRGILSVLATGVVTGRGHCALCGEAECGVSIQASQLSTTPPSKSFKPSDPAYGAEPREPIAISSQILESHVNGDRHPALSKYFICKLWSFGWQRPDRATSSSIHGLMSLIVVMVVPSMGLGKKREAHFLGKDQAARLRDCCQSLWKKMKMI